MNISIPKLLVLSPQGQSRDFQLIKFPLSIGRAEQNDLVLSDERASRNHALLEKFGSNSFAIKDLGSRNGTSVNGVEIKQKISKVLKDGDEIKIGNHRLIFDIGKLDLDYDDNPLGQSVIVQSAADLLRPFLLSSSQKNLTRLSDSSFPLTNLDQSSLSEVDLLTKRSYILGVIYDLNKLLNRTFTVEEVYTKIADHIFKVSNGGRVVFSLLSNGEVEIKWGQYRDDNVKNKYDGIPVSRTIVNKVCQDGVSLLSIDPMLDPNLRSQDTFRFGQIRSVMCAPIMEEDKIIGAIYVDRPEAVGFNEEDLNFLTAVASTTAMAVDNISAHQKLLRDAQVRTTYERFLPPFVVEQIIANPSSVELGGVNQTVTILFADIRGFTSFAEKKPPQEVVILLNSYFERAAEIIFKYEGTLDKFIGDGIMALFGAPNPSRRDSTNAIEAAVALQEEVKIFNEELRNEGKDFGISIGVGINTGEVTAGYIGSKLRTDYTVIGDSVNLAARLESRAKPGQILIGELTYASTCVYLATINERANITPWADSKEEKYNFLMRPIGSLKLKGKTEQSKVYRVLWGDEVNEEISDLSISPDGGVIEDISRGFLEKNVEQMKDVYSIGLQLKILVSGIKMTGESFNSECTTENISVRGICLRLDSQIPLGSIVTINGLDTNSSLEAEVYSVNYIDGYHQANVRFI